MTISNLNDQLINALKNTLKTTDEEANSIIYKDELENVRLLAAIRFLAYTEKIQEEASVFKLLGILFTVESLVAAKQDKKEGKVQKSLRDNLNVDQKVQLLDGFIWSEEYDFRKGKIFPLRHIMFSDFNSDLDYKKNNYLNKEIEYCSAGRVPLCNCVKWLRSNPAKINCYLDKLVHYLYEMRHAIVHESFPVLGFPIERKDDGIQMSFNSLLDAFPVTRNKERFRAYEAFIERTQLFDIFKSCIKNYLLHRLKTK